MAKVVRVILCRVEAIEHDALVANYSAGPVHGKRIHAPRIHVPFGACDEEGSGPVHRVQPHEVQISPVHDGETARLDKKNVEHVDIVQLAVADSGDLEQVKKVQMTLLRQSDERVNDRYGKSALPLRQRARQAHANVAELVMGGVDLMNRAG